jgi:glycerol-3-phosphate O-acyltransferase/dihydroxyacetone phosphate acyltransferase
VLVGVWVPKRWDLSLTALSQYTSPRVPPENPWIDRSKTTSPSPVTPGTTDEKNSSNSVKDQARRRPPSRRIVRHVLRARIDAIRALANFFDQLERNEYGKKIRASTHLARLYGFVVESDDLAGNPAGWRRVREVIEFLKTRGAKVPTAREDIEGWVVSSSSGDEYSTTDWRGSELAPTEKDSD